MNRLKITVLALFIILLVCAALNAQIGTSYAFTQNTTVWEPVLGTYATDAMVDEGLTSAIDIGFEFPYSNFTYTQVKISSNGWVGLGTNLNLPYYVNDLATLNIRPLLGPLWDDLNLQFGAVQYSAYGEAPHRVFFVQWLAAQWNYTAPNEYNFMVRMHETGQVDFIYGPHTGAPVNASASIGINMTPGGNGYYFSVLPGPLAQVYSNVQYQNIQTPLESGTMYTFMPKTQLAQNAAAVHLTGILTPMQNVASEYTVKVGNAGTANIAADTAVAYLMRGEDVLDLTYLPAITSGSFGEATFSWAPDTTGLMYIYAKVELAGDADSLNNATFPFAITVQPYVGNDDEVAPVAGLWLKTYPNPFQDRVVIQYRLEKSEQVRIGIYNLKGQKVTELVNDSKTQGDYTAEWDGRDDKGGAVPAGVYLVRVKSDSGTVSKKLILLR